MTSSNRFQLNALTSIRFPAMLIIVIFHLWSVNGMDWVPLWVGELIGLGYVMGTFFFVLSGFVLACAYAGKELELRRFWQTRLARLYPLYLFSLLIAAPDFFHDAAKLADEVPMFTWIGHHLVLFGAACILATIAVHHSIPYALMHTGFLAPAFVTIILGLAYKPTWSIPLGKRPLVFLGKTSYALYLLHLPVLVRWLFVDSKPPEATTPWVSMAGVGMTILAALLSYWAVERPSRKWLAGRSKCAVMVEQRI